jgi:hypothetical protein
MIELNYELTDKDLFNFNLETLTIKQVLLNAHKMNLIMFSIMAIFCGIFFTSALMGEYIIHWFSIIAFVISFIIALLLLIIIGILGQIIFGGLAIKLQMKGIDRSTKALINDSEITNENSMGKTTYNWSAAKGVYNKKHNILIFIGPIQAIVIPKRIFNTEQEIEETWNYIQECYNKANNK